MPTNGWKLLVVDDDPDFLEVNRRVLEGHGYQVRCYTDSRRALHAMIEERPDLVVTDLMMHELDAGFTLSSAIKSDPRFAKVPVIVVTGVATRLGYDFTPTSDEELRVMCADAFFNKPVRVGRLLEKIAELLEAGGEGA